MEQAATGTANISVCSGGLHDVVEIFGKENGLRAEEDDDLSTRTFRRILGLDSKFSHILLMYSVWNLLHSTHMQLHIYKYIYIYLKHTSTFTNIDFFLKKRL